MVPWGGYPQAERCRLTVGRGDAVAAFAADPQQVDLPLMSPPWAAKLHTLPVKAGLLFELGYKPHSSVLQHAQLCEACQLLLSQTKLIAAVHFALLFPEGLLAVQMGSVAAVNVKGTFMFDPKNHRDFLGACLGTGIERSKVGDILIQGEQGAHIMVKPYKIGLGMHEEWSSTASGPDRQQLEQPIQL